MRLNVAGTCLCIEGKMIQCPSTPLYVVKSFGHVVTIERDHYLANNIFEACVGTHLQLWRMGNKGAWKLLRESLLGKERGK